MKLRMVLIVILLALPIAAFAVKPPEVIFFGDLLTWRENDLTDPAHRDHWGTEEPYPELRLLFCPRSNAVRPYLKITGSMTDRNIPDDDTAASGPGIEWRPFSSLYSLERHSTWDLLSRTRFYTEYLWQGFWRSPRPDGNPRYDLAIGVEAYRAYGALDDAEVGTRPRWWRESYVSYSYHTTDFYDRQDRDGRIGGSLTLGGVYGTKLPVMPYAEGSVDWASQQKQFWENKVQTALGIRIQPHLYSYDHVQYYLFAEERWVLSYLKDRPLAGSDIPGRDTRIGLNITYDRY